MINDKSERMYQIYSWYKTARLNVLYYEASLRKWTQAVKIHDIVIALSGAASPIAFWKHSSVPAYQQTWFYLTLFAAFSALLKPILRWENQVKLFAELETHYCDLYMDLKYLCEDIAANKDLSSKSNSLFEHYRNSFKALERKEPPPNKAKTRRIEAIVNSEIDINKCWFPPEE
jgi:hypothetical protein